MIKRKSSVLKYTVVLLCLSYPIYMYFYIYKKFPSIQGQHDIVSEAVLLPPPTLPKFNTECLTENVERNVDHHHRDSHRKYWDQLSDKSIRLYKQGWKQFIAQEKVLAIPEWDQAQGIVFVAGNDDTLKRTMGTIRLLQHEYKCVLPIEIWHMEHEADTAASFESEVQSFKNVRLRDLSDFGLSKSLSRHKSRNKQFQVKAAAIINSSFRDVLYLDSDNIPTRDPTFLFDTKEFKQTGAIFWPDFWKTAAENKIFRILEIECQDTWEQESGQIVVDKKRHWLPLQLSWFMQFYHELYFNLLNGDKDTFQYAWQALDAPFYRIKTFVGMAGLLVQGKFCGHSMLQYMDNMEEPLFVHANLMKQMPKKVFIKNEEEERPWHLIKRYVDDQSNNYLKPVFYMTNQSSPMGCMNFATRSTFDESPSFVDSFDEVLQNFQDLYFQSGGIGGYT
ncbi:mannosyltransferase putative-domain-containing protein [Helicostylum pulchrum]|uniref:Uncharacterized protein n=1 Tax=Helicostylum pulchrum TaxID=562976 RepID=A0ABP9XMT7_9FUNG|nr:mannosyltransferase putative-domain-containing protein [Helicostylum pulchrum]